MNKPVNPKNFTHQQLDAIGRVSLGAYYAIWLKAQLIADGLIDESIKLDELFPRVYQDAINEGVRNAERNA